MVFKFRLRPFRLGPRIRRQVPKRIGRSGAIRTPDPLLPKQVRYQAALRSAQSRAGGRSGPNTCEKADDRTRTPNLRPHRRQPPSPKVSAIQQPARNRLTIYA